MPEGVEQFQYVDFEVERTKGTVEEAGVSLPSHLSASPDPKLADVLAGCFASLEAVPTAGWLQIMVLTCMQEAGTGFASKPQTDDAEPGDIALDSWVRYDPTVSFVLISL